MSEPVFMAQIRAADIPESMPVSRAIRDFMVAHPPTPEGQPTEERHCQLEQSEGDFRRFAFAIHQVACDV